jgi:hypothetical protein
MAKIAVFVGMLLLETSSLQRDQGLILESIVLQVGSDERQAIAFSLMPHKLLSYHAHSTEDCVRHG